MAKKSKKAPLKAAKKASKPLKKVAKALKKLVKKVSKPVGKAVKAVPPKKTAKKPVKVVKKAAPKKAAKPVKKVAPKAVKPVKAAKPAKAVKPAPKAKVPAKVEPKKVEVKVEQKKQMYQRPAPKKPAIIDEKAVKAAQAKVAKATAKMKVSTSVAEEISKLLPKENIVMKEASNRKYFNARLDQDVVLPNLIEIQIDSYRWFLEDGIRELLDEINPISDFSGKKLELHFLEHSIG